MEFKISQSEAERCFQRVQGFINLKGVNPIISNVLIKTTKTGIDVFATDYDIGLRGSYVASVGEEGTVTLHGKMIYDIVRQLPDEDIMIRYSGTGRCEIACGKSNFKLSTIDSDEFPEEPEFPVEKLVNLDTEMFKDMMKKTAYAISANESRMTLNGIFCDVYPNTFKMVATDGHRLAFVSRSVDLPIKDPISMIIPRKAVIEILKLLDEEDGSLQMVRSDSRIFFKKGTLIFFAREVEGSFPNYEQVIPRKNSKTAIVDVERLKQAIRRVSTVAVEKSHLINLNFKKDKMEISSEVSEVGEAHEEIEIEYSQEPLKIGLNSAYTLEALNHIQSEKAIFKMEKPLDAVMIKPTDDDDFISIVMPMRI